MIDEQILVVKRTNILAHETWHGLNQHNTKSYIAAIKAHKEFLPRAHMETDPRYKQIIPYLVFRHDERYFLMQRQSKASEQRLKNKYTLGIGGHIRQEDMTSDDIFAWAHREFHEEVNYAGSFDIKPIGLLNDDTNEVGKVHLGLVLILEGDSDNIRIKSELKNGQLLTLAECAAYYENMESWSQIIFDYLKNQPC